MAKIIKETWKRKCSIGVEIIYLVTKSVGYFLLPSLTQVQGLEEHFRDSCGGVIKWLDQETYYTAFTEGWGLYAENPLIGEDTDVYKDEPLQKYGMLKWQVSINNRSRQTSWNCQPYSY